MELTVDERRGDDELAALADQARAGSADAFDTLARRVRDRVHRWAHGVTQDHDDADDVAQLVLLRLHARLDRFEGRSRFTTWLYRLTRNVAFSRVARERSRAQLLAARTIEMDGEETVADDVRDEGTTVRLAQIARGYFDGLPQRQRDVYALCDVRGLNSREAAEKLGITPSTARGLLMKARRRIRLRMLEQHKDLLEEYTP